MNKFFKIFAILFIIIFTSVIVFADYNNVPPMPNKYLMPDGSITTWDGVVVSPPDSGRAQKYNQSQWQIAKWLMPDGSIVGALPFTGSGNGVVEDSNCNQSKYYPINSLCAQTDTGTMYQGTGTAVKILGNGADGLPIIWKGDFASAPSNPSTNWAYRNTSLGIAYVYDGASWQIMVQDGIPGADGLPYTQGLASALPATCIVPTIYYATDTLTYYGCTTASNWSKLYAVGTAGQYGTWQKSNGTNTVTSPDVSNYPYGWNTAGASPHGYYYDGSTNNAVQYITAILNGINALTWVSGSPHVTMTGAGTFGLDTNTYCVSGSACSGYQATLGANAYDPYGAAANITLASLGIVLGVGANDVPQMTSAGKYPAADGSLITNFTSGQIAAGNGWVNGGLAPVSGKPLMAGTGANASTANITLQGTAGSTYNLDTMGGGLVEQIVAIFDGGGAVIPVNSIAYVHRDYAISSINEWTVTCNAEDATPIVIDVFGQAYSASSLPSSTLCSTGTKPTGGGASAYGNQATWNCGTTSSAANYDYAFKVTTAPSTSTWCVVTLKVTR